MIVYLPDVRPGYIPGLPIIMKRVLVYGKPILIRMHIRDYYE